MTSNLTTITTCTRDCPNTCGLSATVRNGRLVKLEGAQGHPLTRGHACVKASMYIDRVYHAERIHHPMIRSSRKSGNWQRATWDQALDAIANRMERIRDEDGPEAILYYQGYGERTALKLLNNYFFNLFGGVTTLRGSLCGGTGQVSQNMDMGERISHDPMDHLNSQAVILWGRNPVSTNISLVPILQKIKNRGGVVVLIDPYKNRSASLADRHIAPKPGCDVFLALAAANIVLEKSNENKDFIANHCVGSDAFLQIVNRFSFPELCKRADVPEDDAIFLAKVLMENKPAATLLGWGMHRHEKAHYSIRAIDALAAICGNIGIAGGGVSQGFEEYGPYDQQFWGDDLNPPRRTLLMPVIGDEIANAVDPKIRMIFTTAANPVCMAPNSKKVAKAFDQTEFVVYSGHFLDDTADHAHVFLPATTFLEEHDVMASYGHNYVGPVNQAIEPVGECLSDYRIFCGLAERLFFADRFVRDEEDWLFDICAPIREQGCTIDALRKGPFRLKAPMAPYLDGAFPTPSGKFEFMTGFDPDDLTPSVDRFPYTLLTTAPHKFLCSERSLADHPPLPVVRIHPDEAKARQLADGQVVWLKSPVDQVKVQLQTDPGARRDCVVAERGGWIKAGHGLNRLTSDIPSEVGDGTPYYETTVSIMPLGENR
jgi:anaerobic selenocysteine-containing dehydrogenase